MNLSNKVIAQLKVQGALIGLVVVTALIIAVQNM